MRVDNVPVDLRLIDRLNIRALTKCARVDLGRGAYNAAPVAFPDQWITLRQGIRVVEKSHVGA